MPSDLKMSRRKREEAPSTVAPAAASNDAPKISSVDQVVSEILRGLYEGRYVAGQKLTESDITGRFAVGRGTVREALCRLAAEGLVTISMHRGASIRALSRNDVRDILEVIEALMGLSARLAAERIASPQEEESLRETLALLVELADAGDPFEFAGARTRFYLKLAEISGNLELARLVPTMVQTHLIGRVRFLAAYGLDVEKKWATDFRRVIDAILARDGKRAERAMRRHVQMAAQAIQKLPDGNFGP